MAVSYTHLDVYKRQVHDKSLQAAESLEKLLVSTDYDELYSPEIDRKALQLMALYHDTGMDGNIDFSEYEATREKDKTGDFETQLRKKHSVQSAVHALRDRQFIEGKTVSADRVAIGCLLHSKSNSDVKNLADPAEWECAVDRLKKAVADFNEVHPEERIFFDDSFLRDENGALSKSELSKLRSECLCLRIGDANGHDYESRTSQNGKAIDFSLRDWKQKEATMSDKLQTVSYTHLQIPERPEQCARFGRRYCTVIAQSSERNGISCKGCKHSSPA